MGEVGSMLFGRALDALGGDGTKDYNPLYGAQQVDPDEFYKHIVNNYMQEYNSDKPDYYQLKDFPSAAATFEDNNPGFKKPTKSVWIDSEGNDVSDKLNAMSPKQRYVAVNTGYNSPGFFKRMTSTGAQEAAFNRNAIQEPGEQLQANSTGNLTGGRNFEQVQPFAPKPISNIANPIAGSMLLGRNYTAANMGDTATSMMNNQRGIPAINSDINLYGAQNQRFASQNVDPIKNALARQQFQRLYGRDPVLENIQDAQAFNELTRQTQNVPAEQQLALTNTGTQQEIANQNRLIAPAQNYLQGVTGLWGLQNNNMDVRKMPGAGSVGLNGVVTPGRYLSPEMMGAVSYMSGGIPGITGGIAGNSPQPINVPGVSRGVIYNPPPVNNGQNQVLPPINTIGQSNSSQPTIYQNQMSKTTVPINGIDGVAYADPETGRVYNKEHQDVTNYIDDITRQAVIRSVNQQRQEQQNDAQDAEHKRKQAAIDANVALLKAQKAQLEAEHLKTGLLPLTGQMVSGAASDVGSMFKQVGKDYYNAGKKYIGTPLYNTLIGE